MGIQAAFHGPTIHISAYTVGKCKTKGLLERPGNRWEEILKLILRNRVEGSYGHDSKYLFFIKSEEYIDH